MAKPKRPPIQPHWWSKTLAGCVLGFSLALALMGLFAWLGPGGIEAPNKVQFNMWLVPVIWMAVFAFVYLFRTGLRAWLWLGAANVAAFSALLVARLIMEGG